MQGSGKYHYFRCAVCPTVLTDAGIVSDRGRSRSLQAILARNAAGFVPGSLLI